MAEERNKVYDFRVGPCGRHDIKIPVSELTTKNLKEYAATIMGIFFENQSKIDYLENYYRGLQDIRFKTKEVRPEINNKVVENHAFEIVEFIKGYMYGRPINYAQIAEDKLLDDIEQLNTYMRDQGKAKKDTDIIEDMAIAGVGYYMCLPRDISNYKLNIVKTIISKELVYDPKYNLEKESPFNLYRLDPKSTFTIKSSLVGNETIGAGVITKVGDNEYILTVYAPNKRFECKVTGIDGKGAIDSVDEENTILPYIPIIEYSLNSKKMGLIEVVKDMLDALNGITSDQLDDIDQFVNSLLVFMNADIDEETFESFLKLGAIKLKNPVPAIQADIKQLSEKLEHTDVNSFYDRVYSKMLSIVAVPKATGQATSGGDTGDARALGEGWTLAEQRASSYQNTITDSEMQLLKIALYICRNTQGCKIETLYPSDVKIQFSRSRSDNMLIKSQVIMNLKAAGLPEETIAQVCELFDAPLEVAQQWKLALEKAKEEAMKQNNYNNNNGLNNGRVHNIDNPNDGAYKVDNRAKAISDDIDMK